MSDYGESRLEATGNHVSRHKSYLEVSGGSGNLGSGGTEVHLRLIDSEGYFAQSWFSIDELRAAIDKAEDAGRI